MIALVSLATSLGARGAGATHLTPDAPPDTSLITPEYFGLHLHRAVALRQGEATSVWPDVGFGSWRLWDAHTAWADLEPARDHWEFARLDSCVELARRHKVGLLLTLGLTPQWASSRPSEPSNYGPGNQAPPSDTLDWRRYIDTVARRYRGRIASYEVWNEPNLKGFYSGNPSELARLARIAYETIKGIDPSAVVSTPSATGVPGGAQWLAEYLAAGGGAYADVVGFHFYVTPGDPERMMPAFAQVRIVLDEHGVGRLPLWDTETGWLMQNHDAHIDPAGPPGTFGSRVLDFDTSAALVARALVVGRCGGLARFYWYAWDNRRMGLIDADGRTQKQAASAYAQVRRWLVGSRVEACDTTANGTWVVHVRAPHRRRAVVVWSTMGDTTFELPAGSKARSIEPLLQQRRSYSNSRRRSIDVTPFPRLVELR